MAIQINDDIERQDVKGGTVWRCSLSELSDTKMVWRLRKFSITDVFFQLGSYAPAACRLIICFLFIYRCSPLFIGLSVTNHR